MKCLYSFGYQTPAQVRGQEAHGWDDEDSWELMIEAGNEQEALVWGREIAEEFVRRLFAPEAKSWRAMKFADGVRSPSSPNDAGAFLVRVGEHPDYETMLNTARRTRKTSI